MFGVSFVIIVMFRVSFVIGNLGVSEDEEVTQGGKAELELRSKACAPFPVQTVLNNTMSLHPHRHSLASEWVCSILNNSFSTRKKFFERLFLCLFLFDLLFIKAYKMLIDLEISSYIK